MYYGIFIKAGPGDFRHRGGRAPTRTQFGFGLGIVEGGSPPPVNTYGKRCKKPCRMCTSKAKNEIVRLKTFDRSATFFKPQSNPSL